MQPKDTVTFYCRQCKKKFQDRPDVIEEAPDEQHPWIYLGKCPQCEELVEQAWWERNLLKAWANATGPRTPEGKAAAAANLEGHPTPEEALLTRFNGIKHGLYAQTATYFPARPGKYPECDTCELRENVCEGERACLKKTELFMKFHIAFDSRDPGLLMQIQAGNQAAIQGLLNQCIMAIAMSGGPEIHEPQWYYDKDGKFHLAKYKDGDGDEVQLYEKKAHPLLKFVIDLINKNNVTMSDLEMTPKAKEEQEALKGFIESQKPEGGESLEQISHQMKQGLDSIKDMIKRSQEKSATDPVLIEYQQEEANG